MGATAGNDDDSLLQALREVRSNIASIAAASDEAERSLSGVDHRLSRGLEAAEAAAEALAPLQTQSMSTKALHARINRAVSPALAVLRSFSLVESLQRRLLRLSSDDRPATPARLLKYVNAVDRLRDAVVSVTDGCDPAVQRLQEAVEFLSRTKSTDQLRIRRLCDTLAALRSLYETEVDAMRYDGLLDESLLDLQDQFEYLLLQLRHQIATAGDDAPRPLGSDLEVEVLRRIAETLASNDCLDICIDIFVKVRYRRAAKALMRLNPEYLRTYAAEEIDGMEWEAQETAISLWIEHLELAVGGVFVAEKRLSGAVLGGVMGGAVWPECLAKIADKIMAVFFRFGEGVARSSKEPQKLFKVLDMLDAMDRMRPGFLHVFDGEPGGDICDRFRELQKLLVHAASKIFWELGLQIEGLPESAPPPADGAVPKDIRYAVNYLKCLSTREYAAAMGRVLRTEQVWKAGFLSRPEPDEALLRDAVVGVMDALQRNVEARRCRYRDRAVGHAFAMNAYWYMYMRGKGSELAALVGEEAMRRRYKAAAEEAAYAYQAEAWGPLVKLLEREEDEEEPTGAVARGKLDAFGKGLEENLRRHRGGGYISIPDLDLREQIKEAVTNLVVEAYAAFLDLYAPVMQARSSSFPTPDSMQGLLAKLFDGGRESGRERKLLSGGSRRAAEGDYSGGDGGEGGRRSSEGMYGGRGGQRWRRPVEGLKHGGDGVEEEARGRGSLEGKYSGGNRRGGEMRGGKPNAAGAVKLKTERAQMRPGRRDAGR